jgi:predicted MPP superfamily phosphohydrolase
MKIQFASDLHWEFYEAGDFYDDSMIDSLFYKVLDPTVGADLLILAGDIGCPEKTITKEFISWCCMLWPHVVWIYGNHEYYNSKSNFFERYISDTMEDKARMAEEYRKELPNLSILLPGSFTLDKFPDYRIIGATLWTNIPEKKDRIKISLCMNDFNKIVVSDGKIFTINDWQHIHKSHYKFIQNELQAAEKNNQRAIVVTHHLPTYRLCLPQYEGNSINAAFMTEADALLEHPSVATWICGHSHGQRSIQVKKRNGEITECHMNSRGYPNEASQRSYVKNKYIIV